MGWLQGLLPPCHKAQPPPLIAGPTWRRSTSLGPKTDRDRGQDPGPASIQPSFGSVLAFPASPAFPPSPVSTRTHRFATHASPQHQTRRWRRMDTAKAAQRGMKDSPQLRHRIRRARRVDTNLCSGLAPTTASGGGSRCSDTATQWRTWSRPWIKKRGSSFSRLSPNGLRRHNMRHSHCSSSR